MHSPPILSVTLVGDYAPALTSVPSTLLHLVPIQAQIHTVPYCAPTHVPQCDATSNMAPLPPLPPPNHPLHYHPLKQHHSPVPQPMPSSAYPKNLVILHSDPPGSAPGMVFTQPVSAFVGSLSCNFYCRMHTPDPYFSITSVSTVTPSQCSASRY